DVGAAGLAGDLVLADRDKAQRLALGVARRVPVARGAEIAVGDVELMGDLAVAHVDPAAQRREIGAGDAEKRLGVLPPRADKGKELAALLARPHDGVGCWPGGKR